MNDLLATQVPGVYAVGECAEHDGKVYGLVQPIWEQCAVLADVLTGANPRARYRGSKVYARLKVAGVEVASLGVTDARVPDRRSGAGVRGPTRRLPQAGRPRRQARRARCSSAARKPRPTLVQLFDRDEPLPPNRLDVLATGNAPTTAAEREVCNCHHVTESAIVDAIRDGCDTLPALCDATRAGTGCGSCRGQLAGLLAANTQAQCLTDEPDA